VVPIWFVRLTYAEQFSLDPASVNPSLRWYYRWQEWEKTRAAREAVAHRARSENWVKDLSQGEKDLIVWAETDG
jgi:hypothetical protein